MPLQKRIDINAHTQLHLWQVTESEVQLREGLVLTETQQGQLSALRAEAARESFLAVRQLLRGLGYAPESLYYDSHGKPYLADGRHISISHSFDRVGVLLSDEPMGLDIERLREKIVRIAPKFTPWQWQDKGLTQAEVVRHLTQIWSAKEAGFKVHGNPTITLNDITVSDFAMATEHTYLNIEGQRYSVYFSAEADFVVAYCEAVS